MMSDQRPHRTGLLFLAACALCALVGLSGEALGRARSLERVKVQGFGSAIVVAPSKPGKQTPWVIALHGNFDRPSWQCDAWRREVAGRAWLLCPRGMSRRDAPSLRRFTYRSPRRVAKEIAAGRAALERRHAGRIAKGPPALLIGFSLGATYASRLAVRTPRAYPRVLLVEGGHTIWTAKRARAFRRRGGQSVAFACGSGWCARRSRKTCPRLRAAKVDCRAVYLRGLGHSYGKRLGKLAQPLIDAALAGWSARTSP
jgi:pimeloyl-ACP methyl ester carboxylesterase